MSGSGGAECTMEEYIMQLEKCVALHPYAMILREKDMDRQDYRELARHIQVMCREASVKMFVHSDISAAEYAGCGNVHFSMEHFKQMCDEQADVIKRLDCVSVSCHSMEEAVNAVRAGADQIVLGTIFETQCKPGKMGAGLSFLKEVCRAAHTVNPTVKVFAIGGIKPDNIKKVVFPWIADEREYFQLCGYLLMTRLLMKGWTLNERAEAEFLDQAFTVLEGGTEMRKVAARAVCKFALQSKTNSRTVLRMLGNLLKSSKPEIKMVAEEIKNEIEYGL